MSRVREEVTRAKWFDPTDFDRTAAIEQVESNLRDRHEISGSVEVEVCVMMSEEFCVKVTGLTVKQDGESA